jgi:hypothetical protein
MRADLRRATVAAAAWLAATAAAHAGIVEDHYGRWMGTISVPQGPTLRLGLELFARADGSPGGRLVSPDQGDFNVPVDGVMESGGAIEVSAPIVGMRLRLHPDGARLGGEVLQGPYTLPLTLVRNDDLGEPARPQTPKAPFPYRVESLSVTRQDGVVLSGTLTRPAGDRPVTAIVLVAGSGPTDRDESIDGHKIFAVLADYLTRQGFAVYRYDKRGVMRSTGDYLPATETDFARDAEAAIETLRSRKGIARVGVLGHSEGGLLAAELAAEHPHEVAFVVSLAGPGLKGRDLILLQDRAGYEKRGLSAAQIATLMAYGGRFYDAIIANEDVARRMQALAALGQSLSDEDRKLVQQYASQGSLNPRMAAPPALRQLLLSDAPGSWRQVKCPVLALGGDLDVQVPAKENLAAIRQALAEGGDRRAQTQSLPGLNHLFQDAGTGLPDEYGKIDETMSPIVLARIADFLEHQP